jgi:hypothetical protein
MKNPKKGQGIGGLLDNSRLDEEEDEPIAVSDV